MWGELCFSIPQNFSRLYKRVYTDHRYTHAFRLKREPLSVQGAGMYRRSLNITALIVMLLLALAVGGCYTDPQEPGLTEDIPREKEEALSEDEERDVQLLLEALAMTKMDREKAIKAVRFLRAGDGIGSIASIEPVEDARISEYNTLIGRDALYGFEIVDTSGKACRVAFHDSGLIDYIYYLDGPGGKVVGGGSVIHEPIIGDPPPPS